MKKMKLAELVLDFDLYPRSEVNSQHVHYMCEASSAGVSFPPIVVDEKSKRVVDGFHRTRMYQRVLGETASLEVVLKRYPNDQAIFLDAMRYNAGHGRTLTKFDRAHCLLKAEALGIETDQVAASLSITVEALAYLKSDRVGILRVSGKKVKTPLKRTLRHMSGREITAEQAVANEKLGGMEQLFYVNQLIILFENDLIDTENKQLSAGIARLRGLLDSKMLEAA